MSADSSHDIKSSIKINSNSQVVKKKINLKNQESLFGLQIKDKNFPRHVIFHKMIVQNNIKKISRETQWQNFQRNLKSSLGQHFNDAGKLGCCNFNFNYLTHSVSCNLTPPISWVLIGRHLIFCSPAWPKCSPGKYKAGQKAGFPIVT